MNHPIISADSHINEPPDLWTTRMDSDRWGSWIPHRSGGGDTLYVGGVARGRGQEAVAEMARLTGQPTMQQMLAMCDEVQKRGQPRPDPQTYFDRYMDMLLSRTKARIEDVRSGRTSTAGRAHAARRFSSVRVEQ